METKKTKLTISGKPRKNLYDKPGLTNNKNKQKFVTEKKFYKSDFDEILNDPELGKYCDLLLECAMTRRMQKSESMEIDAESYEEVKSISMDFAEELIDPEG